VLNLTSRQPRNICQTTTRSFLIKHEHFKNAFKNDLTIQNSTVT
jgi:hypothetical protein